MFQLPTQERKIDWTNKITEDRPYGEHSNAYILSTCALNYM
jgi:hypothetical protein